MDPYYPPKKASCCLAPHQLGGTDVFYTGPNIPAFNIITNDTLNDTVQKLATGGIGGGGYNDENAQDAVGLILTNTPSITFTYNDVTPPSISAAVVDAYVLSLISSNPNSNYIHNQALVSQVASSRITGNQAAGSFTALLSSITLANRPTDPTVTNGAMVYRTDLNRMRVVVNGLWQNVVTEDQIAVLTPPAIFNQNASAQTANFWINGTGTANELYANKFSFPAVSNMSITSDGLQLILDNWTSSRGISLRAGGVEYASFLRNAAGENKYFFRINSAFDIQSNQQPFGVSDNMGSMNLIFGGNPAGWNQFRIKGYDISYAADPRWSLAHKIVLYHPNTGIAGNQDTVKGVGIGSNTTHMHFSVPDNGGFSYYGGPILPTQSAADFAVQNGGLVYRTDTNKFRACINGVWYNLAIEAQLKTITATTYTLLPADSGNIISFTSAAPVIVNVPTGLPVGFNCAMWQNGAGAITFVPSGTTILNRWAFTKTNGLGAGVTLNQTGAEFYNIQGEME